MRQNGAPWGLARISHRPKLSLSTFRIYEHDPEAGKGVNVYVLDTGINIDHQEFQGRASWGVNFVDDANDDTDGSGTHLAGIICSRRFGVAKSANIVA